MQNGEENRQGATSANPPSPVASARQGAGTANGCPRCGRTGFARVEWTVDGFVCLDCLTEAERAEIEAEQAEYLAAMAGGPALRVVCAWCGRVTREGDPGADTSHGICKACVREYFPAEVGKIGREGTRMKERAEARTTSEVIA